MRDCGGRFLLACKLQAQQFPVMASDRQNFKIDFHRLTVRPATEGDGDDLAAFAARPGAPPDQAGEDRADDVHSERRVGFDIIRDNLAMNLHRLTQAEVRGPGGNIQPVVARCFAQLTWGARGVVRHHEIGTWKVHVFGLVKN